MTITTKSTKKLIIAGEKFGKWTTLKLAKTNPAYWLCHCDCGKEKEVSAQSLKNGQSKSCGCSKRGDLTGKRFGKLLVLNKSNKSKLGVQYYLCKCDCGTQKTMRGTFLGKEAISCGCYNKEHNLQDPTKRIQGTIDKGEYSKHISKKGISFAQFCRSHGLTPKVVRSRLKRGWGIERTLLTPPEENITKRNRRSRAKGKKLEKYVADRIRDFFELDDEDVQPVASSKRGVDIILSKKGRKTIPLSIECKNTVDLFSIKAIEQARKNTIEGTYPAVIWHEPNIEYSKSVIIFDFNDFLNFYEEVASVHLTALENNFYEKNSV